MQLSDAHACPLLHVPACCHADCMQHQWYQGGLKAPLVFCPLTLTARIGATDIQAVCRPSKDKAGSHKCAPSQTGCMLCMLCLKLQTYCVLLYHCVLLCAA